MASHLVSFSHTLVVASHDLLRLLILKHSCTSFMEGLNSIEEVVCLEVGLALAVSTSLGTTNTIAADTAGYCLATYFVLKEIYTIFR